MWQILFLPTQTHFALGYRDSIFACSSWLEMGLRFTDIWNIMYLYDSGFQTSPQTKLISSPISYTGVSLGNNPSANPLYFKQCALGIFSGLCSLLESVGGSFTLYNSKMSQPLVHSCRCPPPPPFNPIPGLQMSPIIVEQMSTSFDIFLPLTTPSLSFSVKWLNSSWKLDTFNVVKNFIFSSKRLSLGTSH